MLIFDQLKKNDPQLRFIAIAVSAGLSVLLVGLWWVQIVSSSNYEANLQTQSYRTVRIPAVRGKILDRSGAVLAENRPTYNVSLYLEELRKSFDAAYSAEIAKVRERLQREAAAEEQRLGHKLNKQEKRKYTLSVKDKNALRQKARYEVSSNVVLQVGQRLSLPLTLDPTNFLRHYETRLALPFPVVPNLNENQIARFEEQATSPLGVDLEIQSTRIYPFQSTAGHLLGYLKRDDSSAVGEESFFSYRLPDFRGLVGIEGGFDARLRGRAGAKSVLVNNIGYRQAENIWSPAEAGENLRTTIDLAIQQAAESALPVLGPTTRGAVVVMEVNTGDILALVSAPGLNPNNFVQGFPPGERQRLDDPKLRPQINRATQENYAPGSIFKTLIGLAALEAGLNPAATYQVEPDPHRPTRGCVFVGKRKIEDTVEPGSYDFRRALIRSSNSYFITNGIHTGIDRIVALARKFHLGERTGLPTRQETPGIFPSPDRVRSGWSDGETANICIGQGQMAVTPLQMAVMISAIANGGNVLWPRLVHSIEPAEPIPGCYPEIIPPGRVREVLGVKKRSLDILRAAMLDDVEHPDGTGKAAAVPGMRICGKTGTAQVTNARNELTDHTTWFASFAPYEHPKYAVIVMVESGGSGGATCAPIAHHVYAAIQERERALASAAVAKAN